MTMLKMGIFWFGGLSSVSFYSMLLIEGPWWSTLVHLVSFVLNYIVMWICIKEFRKQQELETYIQEFVNCIMSSGDIHISESGRHIQR